MKYRQDPLTTPSQLPPLDDDAERSYLLLEDLVIAPVSYELSDFGDLPDALPPAGPPVH